MSAYEWGQLFLYAVGGGLIGWCYTQVRDAWRQRPVVVWDYETAHWRSARIVTAERYHQEGRCTPPD